VREVVGWAGDGAVNDALTKEVADER